MSDHALPMVQYRFTFPFEDQFDPQPTREWMAQNWYQCFYYIGVYMILVFGGQAYMRYRSRFELQRTLAAWNTFLAVFSIFGASRTIPEVIWAMRTEGFSYSVCNSSFIESVKVSGCWSWLFTLSKVPELGDTIFIVLRKRPLMFLHWYHHITVLIYAWYVYTEYNAPARWFVVMNYTVHSVMYSYYALKSLRFNIPNLVSRIITSMQLFQMVVGCYVSVWAYLAKRRGENCQISFHSVYISFLMYFSYFLLFASFFYKAYLAPRSQRENKKLL